MRLVIRLTIHATDDGTCCGDPCYQRNMDDDGHKCDAFGRLVEDAQSSAPLRHARCHAAETEPQP